MIIQCGLFQHIYHIGCAFDLHSIINNGLIPGGQNSSKRQTVFFLPIDPRDKEHQDPEHIDFSVPRRAQYLHSAWKKHQNAVFWVDIDLAIQKGLTFYQTRSNAIILQGTLPAYCIPKVVRLKTGEVLYEKTYMSPRPLPKISLRHDHDWTRGNDKLGSTVEQQPVGKIVRQSCGEVQRTAFSQPTQPRPKQICDRSGGPDSTEDVFVVKGETSRSHEINEKRLHEELGSSDRSGKPDILSENTRVEQTHDRSGQPDERNSSSAHTVKEQFAPEENRDIALFNTDNEFNRAINEEDIDFNIPGLPHSAVKQSHGKTFKKFDSEDREPPSSTSTSKRSSTTSTIQSFQQRIKRHDSCGWEHRIMRTARCATQSTVQNMPVVLGRRHCLLYVRALLAKWNGGAQAIHQEHSRFPITTSRKGDSTGTATGRSRGIFDPEEMQEETFLGYYSRPVHP